MKKYLILILTVFLLAACSDKDETKNENGNEENTTQTGGQVDTEEQADEKEDKIYGIGETATITSDLYDFDYEVTVNDFQAVDEVDGTSIYDYVLGLEEEDPTRFAVVDVTIKNISDEAYVPSEMFSANFSNVDEGAGYTSEPEFSPELDEELAPGDEINSKIVYTHDFDGEEAYWFKYEIMSDEETIFELPNPGK
ncbi:DUF4352 domain-containing protein [Ornithinibacillus gellani]|uniref:DUF4352 domain-containing protein n=1 Tax=Ornithinibacillus gellani TaxID=2293253 RepID=UPI000F485AB4|nr:DUF4352 domain-containing protein [Ornithinibacillus gellani]TQS71886.1 DUF4352 domain-containing protein [Ornithinibacillus gellani]